MTSAWVPVGEVETDISRLVVASGTVGDAPPLVAPAWGGLVEQVAIAEGSVLRSGDPVVVIDGLTRLAAHTPRPFRRPLGAADRGQDVADLNVWLAGEGYEASEGDRFGSATRRGIRALREAIGLDTEVDSFDPVWLVYLPRPEVTIRSVALQVGVPAPSAGASIAELEAQIAEVALLVPATTASQAAAPAPTTTAPGAPTTTTPAGAATATTPSAGPAPEGTSGLNGSGGPIGTPLTAAAEGAVLEHAGTVLGPVGPDGTMPDETLFGVLPLLGAQASVPLRLVEPEPQGVRAVPAAAIFTGPTGRTCVAYRNERGAPPTVGLVTPRAEAGDRTLLAGLPDGTIEGQVNAPAATRRLCHG